MIKHRTELNQIIDLSLPVAEVGVAAGDYSKVIHSWGVAQLYLVDTWEPTGIPGDGSQPKKWHDDNYATVLNLFKKVTNVTLLKGLSLDMSAVVEDDSLGMVYLDACHLEEHVMQDLLHWWPKLKSGGIMAGHDLINPAFGVKQAVTAFTKGLKLTYEIIPEDSEEFASFYIIKP